MCAHFSQRVTICAAVTTCITRFGDWNKGQPWQQLKRTNRRRQQSSSDRCRSANPPKDWPEWLAKKSVIQERGERSSNATLQGDRYHYGVPADYREEENRRDHLNARDKAYKLYCDLVAYKRDGYEKIKKNKFVVNRISFKGSLEQYYDASRIADSQGRDYLVDSG